MSKKTQTPKTDFGALSEIINALVAGKPSAPAALAQYFASHPALGEADLDRIEAAVKQKKGDKYLAVWSRLRVFLKAGPALPEIVDEAEKRFASGEKRVATEYNAIYGACKAAVDGDDWRAVLRAKAATVSPSEVADAAIRRAIKAFLKAVHEGRATTFDHAAILELALEAAEKTGVKPEPEAEEPEAEAA